MGEVQQQISQKILTRMVEQSNWSEYSKLVLSELTKLTTGIEKLNGEMQELKKEIAIIKDREDNIQKIIEWKDKLSEVVSTSQLAETMKDVAALKEFKVRAITIFVVVQSLVSLAFIVLNYIK